MSHRAPTPILNWQARVCDNSQTTMITIGHKARTEVAIKLKAIDKQTIKRISAQDQDPSLERSKNRHIHTNMYIKYLYYFSPKTEN